MEYEHLDGIESLDALTKSLYRVINEAADLIAAFDGRFRFTPVNETAIALLEFAKGTDRVSLHIRGIVHHPNLIEVSLEWSLNEGEKRRSNTVYYGPFDMHSCRQDLCTALAALYGQIIRNELL